ncbi:MAG TPA: glycosyltransferase family 4 protein [Ignavibacteriaceae bacterium]|nr:glycosyltransferase family 4 protein [Ignavibacteriaceae bacterium]
MKVLVISPSIYPITIGGMEIYNYYFIKELKKLGHKVSLLSIHSGKISLGIPQHKMYSNNSFLQSIQIFFHLLLNKYDIVHIPYCSNSFIANPIGIFKLFFKKNDYVIYIHGGGMYKWDSPKKQNLFFKKAKAIFSVSDPIKKEYEERTGRKVTTILPLIPYEESKKDRKEIRDLLNIDFDKKIMIYVGSIKSIKGSDFLTNSFIKLGKKFFKENNLIMIFIGDGNLRIDLEKVVLQNNMQSEIIFLGRKQKEEVQDYLNASDYFIFASQFEGTPLSLLEAMHNKLLIIATNVTGINNIIHNKTNGLLFSRDDFDSFKCALEFALLNNIECNKMIEHSKNITLKNFDYQKNILEHLRLYAQ